MFPHFTSGNGLPVTIASQHALGQGNDFYCKYGKVMYKTAVLSSFSMSIFHDIQMLMSIVHLSTQVMLS